MRHLVLAAMLALIVLPTTAHAKRHSHRHSSHIRTRSVVDANGNYATVTTALGLKATVIASAREAFQGFINDVEAGGSFIRDLGCKSSGHMPGSKHHWGGACDFEQARRNVTSKVMYAVTDIARKWGLVDGCTWQKQRGERYTGPDCGHIEVPGSNIARRNPNYKVAGR